MGFKISKSIVFVMFEVFVKVGNIFEVKKIYYGMKVVGYFFIMYLYRVMIGLLFNRKRVRDVEVIVIEMEEVGF